MPTRVATEDSPRTDGIVLQGLRQDRTEDHAQVEGGVSIPSENPASNVLNTASIAPLVAGPVPITAWLIAGVGFSERFSYYGLSAPLQNYMQNPAGSKSPPGALGLGQSTATTLSNLFSLPVYIVPVIGAIVADSYMGRYRTAVLSISIYLVGAAILFATSFPATVAEGGGLGGLIAAMSLIGIGLGGVKATITALIADQNTNFEANLVQSKRGMVMTDKTMTTQSIYHVYYLMVNIGSLSSVITTLLERYVSFWAAFLVPFAMLCAACAQLVHSGQRLVKVKPEASTMPKVFQSLFFAATHGFNLDSAKPKFGDEFVDDIKATLFACRVFVIYGLFWLCFGQVDNNLVSQAGQMETHGIPNDMIRTINGISCIVLIPSAQNFLYPALSRRGIHFGPIARMTTGFLIVVLAMAYAAIVQKIIYLNKPCYITKEVCG